MRRIFGIFLLLSTGLRGAPPETKAVVVEQAMIWGRAPHNALTDLVRYHDRWFCVFREGLLPVSPDGALRVLTSADGISWQPVARLALAGADLRDPKFCVTPNGRLWLNAVTGGEPRRSLLWSSGDGREWSDPDPVGEPGAGLGRIAWNLGHAYSAGGAKLFTSADGASFTVHADAMRDPASLLFLPDGTALALAEGALGKSRVPYRGWAWSRLDKGIAGAAVLRLPDERIVVAGRIAGASPRTALCWLDAGEETLTEFLALPSGGETGAPGLVFHEGFLWVSYFSSHEGRAMIYLAKVKLPPLAGGKKPSRLTFGN